MENKNTNQKNVKQDINFFEYPLWMQKNRNTQKLQEFSDIEGYKYSSTKGMPNKVDIRFLYGLMYLSQQNNWATSLVLQRSQFLNLCGMTKNAEKYKRLEESIEKWQGVIVEFKGTFYNNKKYRKFLFHILETVEFFTDNKNVQIRFSPEYLEKIKNSLYFKYIDFEQIKKLNSPLALRLYEILGKTFYSRKKWEIDVFKLAQKIPMPLEYYSKIVQRIKPAVKRIREKTDLKITVEAVKTGKNQGKFIFRKQMPTDLKTKPISQQIEPVIKGPEIPKEILKQIPIKFRPSSLSVCLKILNIYHIDGLNYYIKYANNQKNIKNYGGLLNSLLKLEPGFYEDYLLDQKRQQERQDILQQRLKADLKSQAEKMEKDKQESEDIQNRLSNLTKEELVKLDVFIEQQKLSRFERNRFKQDKKDILRVKYFKKFENNE